MNPYQKMRKDIREASSMIQGLILYGIMNGLFRSVSALQGEQDAMHRMCMYLIDVESEERRCCNM